MGRTEEGGGGLGLQIKATNLTTNQINPSQHMLLQHKQRIGSLGATHDPILTTKVVHAGPPSLPTLPSLSYRCTCFEGRL